MRELTLPGRLILLPGLGSTHGVFARQRQAFGDRLITPDFIPHQPGDSLAHYAQRWAKQLSRPHDKLPLFIGGVSFGGMLAQEMALHIEPRPRAVLLISSARRADTVSSIMQLSEVLGRFVPAGSVPKALSLLKLAFALREGLDDDGKRLLLQGGVDPALDKWASGAAVGWAGFDPPPGYPPIHQIHAKRDWALNAPTDQPGVQWVDGSSHLLHMTHPKTVNRFLFESILSYFPEAQADFPAIEDPDKTAERRVLLEGAPAGTPLV